MSYIEIVLPIQAVFQNLILFSLISDKFQIPKMSLKNFWGLEYLSETSKQAFLLERIRISNWQSRAAGSSKICSKKVQVGIDCPLGGNMFPQWWLSTRNKVQGWNLPSDTVNCCGVLFSFFLFCCSLPPVSNYLQNPPF